MTKYFKCFIIKVYMSGTKILYEIDLKFILRKLLKRSRNSSVGIVMGYGLDGRVSIPGRSKRFFSFPVSRPVLGPTQPIIQWVHGTLSMEVKRPGRDAVHRPPSSVEINNGVAIPPLPHTYSGVVVNLLSPRRNLFLP
jgi:hypothetical protein